jgi:hypothetical protein
MAWTTPRTWAAGETVTSSMMNAHVRDNLNVLKTSIADDGTLVAPQTLSSQTGSVANVAATETTLFTYTIIGGKLATNGQRIRLTATGTHTAAAATKLFKLHFGGTSAAILANAFNSAAGSWVFEAIITRLSATTQSMWTRFLEWQTGSANMVHYGPRAAPAETLSGTVVVKITGQATNNGELTGTDFVVEFLP